MLSRAALSLTLACAIFAPSAVTAALPPVVGCPASFFTTNPAAQYTRTTSRANNFLTLNTGTIITPAINQDDVSYTLASRLPFNVHLYGKVYTPSDLYVCTNGFVSPDPTTDPSNYPIPATTPNPNSPFQPAPAVAWMPFWDDLTSYVSDGSSIKYQVDGVAPNRQFRIQWHVSGFFFNSDQTLSINLIMHENGAIQFQYLPIDATSNSNKADQVFGQGATVGLQALIADANNRYNQYSFNNAFLDGNTALPLTITYDCSGGVKGDPMFTGLLGQVYQVHGEDGGVYNLVSEPSFQLNSKFTFRTSGHCAKNMTTACFAHEGSYIGALSALMYDEDEKKEAVVDVMSGDYSDGLRVQVAGQALNAGHGKSLIKKQHEALSHSDLLSCLSSFNSTSCPSHAVSVSKDASEAVLVTPSFGFIIRNSDLFLNLDLVQPFFTPSAHHCTDKSMPHGILGQTHCEKVYNNYVKYIDGPLDSYMPSDMHASDFTFNRYRV